MDKRDSDHAIKRESLYGTTPEPTYAGVTSFMRRKYVTELDGVDVAVTGVPLDTATTNRPGTRFGPRAIRNASTIMAWEKPYGMDFDPFDKLAVADVGDCYFDHGTPASVPDAIEAHASRIIEQGPGLLTLGGDHFVSYPLLKAHAKKHGAPLSLLHFDAHSDSWKDENDRIDHGTMFYWAAKYGIVDPASSIQVGLRTENPDTLGFNIIDAPRVHAIGIDAVIRCRIFISFLSSRNLRPINKNRFLETVGHSDHQGDVQDDINTPSNWKFETIDPLWLFLQHLET